MKAKMMKWAAAAAGLMMGAAFLTVCPGAHAAVSIQPDLQINGGVSNAFNYCAANSTNSFAGTGTVFFFQGTNPTLEFSFALTGASTANYVVYFDAALNPANGDRWLTNAMAITVAGKGTGTAIGLTNLPAGMRYPAWRVNSYGNTNASTPAMTNVLVRAVDFKGV